MKDNRDWRPTAFVDTSPGADNKGPAGDAGLLGFLRALIVVDALAVLAIPLQGAPRAATSVALVGFLLGLVCASQLHLRLLRRPRRPEDHRLLALAYGLTIAGVFAVAGGWWSSGLALTFGRG